MLLQIACAFIMYDEKLGLLANLLLFDSSWNIVLNESASRNGLSFVLTHSTKSLTTDAQILEPVGLSFPKILNKAFIFCCE